MTGTAAPGAAPGREALEVLLGFLKHTRGFDFTGYKRASLERRIAKRMAEVGIEDYVDYVEHLEVHPDEFAALFDTILINVTGFFRDESAWDCLRDAVVPRIVEAGAGGPIRVWCAGVASGEESYTTAIVLCEALGEDDFRRRVKIYGTDVDEAALQVARQGVFSAAQVGPVPEELRDRYFERVGGRFTFRRDLRRSVIFGRNDLLRDAPISRVDLLSCRNTLMYFNAETQARVLDRFHFALKPTGFLFLGRSETILAHTSRFAPVDVQSRVFAKLVDPSQRERLARLPEPPVETGASDLPGDAVWRTAWDASLVAQVVVDAGGVLVEANRAARTLLGLGATDVGRPLRELELSYRPLEVRGPIAEAMATGREVVASDVPHAVRRGDDRRLEVRVAPIAGPGGPIGTSVSYLDVTARHVAEDELERSRRELGAAYEEVQSTVEELETTNEELQSTNEELETMNEELQSSNEQLETMNDELHRRTFQLDQVNAFLETILTGRGIGLVVVDDDGVVRAWNRPAELQWGLREDEVVGTHLLGLDSGLPADALAGPLRGVLAGDAPKVELVVDAVDRRGRPQRTRITVVRFVQASTAGAVVMTEAAEAPADPS